MHTSRAAETKTFSQDVACNKLDICRLHLQHATHFTDATQVCTSHRLRVYSVRCLPHQSISAVHFQFHRDNKRVSFYTKKLCAHIFPPNSHHLPYDNYDVLKLPVEMQSCDVYHKSVVMNYVHQLQVKVKVGHENIKRYYKYYHMILNGNSV